MRYDCGMTLGYKGESMKNVLAVFVVIAMGLTAFAGSHVCRSRTQTFVLKQGSTSLYLVYECDKNVVSCTPSQVFEALGFEDEGDFTLHGMRANGQRSVISMTRIQGQWTASLSLSSNPKVLDTLACEPYRK